MPKTQAPQVSAPVQAPAAPEAPVQAPAAPAAPVQAAPEAPAAPVQAAPAPVVPLDVAALVQAAVAAALAAAPKAAPAPAAPVQAKAARYALTLVKGINAARNLVRLNRDWFGKESAAAGLGAPLNPVQVQALSGIVAALETALSGARAAAGAEAPEAPAPEAGPAA